MLLILLLIVGMVFYFVPAVIGFRKKNFTAIALVNLLAGWTVVGWIFALIWAIVDKTPNDSASAVLDAPETLDSK